MVLANDFYNLIIILKLIIERIIIETPQDDPNV